MIGAFGFLGRLITALLSKAANEGVPENRFSREDWYRKIEIF